MKKKVGFRDWQRILKDVRRESEQTVQILTAGDQGEIESLYETLGPGAEDVFVKVDQPLSSYDLKKIDMITIVISGSSPFDPSLKDLAEEGRKHGLDVLALIEESGLNEAARQAKLVEAEIAFNLSPARAVLFSPASDSSKRQALLAEIAQKVDHKMIPLAAKVKSFRRLAARQIINEIAGQNGIIGVASFIPASDMPVLTANQIRMVLMIAAAYGAKVSVKRAKELLFVIGGGFTFRAAARQMLGLVPIAGWAVKGAVAYSGTRTIGGLAVKYFEALDERTDSASEPGQPRSR